MSRRMSTLTRALWLAGAMGLACAAAEPPSALSVERRIESMRTLVESSSAARRIETSGSAPAAKQRLEARTLVRLAEEAHAARDEKGASALLDAAARQMMEGTRLASGEDARAAATARGISARIESAEALLTAQKRIASEKASPDAAGTAREIERLLAQARSELAAGRTAEAQALAQKGYLLAKASVGSMRSGDTLVRQLNFASKADEYHYEVDRYQTHRMLVDLLVKKQAGPDALGREAVERAADLHRQAEASAARGDHAGAVGLLENATRELVRAIRAAGVFIPG